MTDTTIGDKLLTVSRLSPGAQGFAVFETWDSTVMSSILFLLATRLRQPLDHRDQTEQRGLSLLQSDF
jgi:hypothetical protein